MGDRLNLVVGSRRAGRSTEVDQVDIKEGVIVDDHDASDRIYDHRPRLSPLCWDFHCLVCNKDVARHAGFVGRFLWRRGWLHK